MHKAFVDEINPQIKSGDIGVEVKMDLTATTFAMWQLVKCLLDFLKTIMEEQKKILANDRLLVDRVCGQLEALQQQIQNLQT